MASMEIRERAIHRSFDDPRARRMPGKFARAMYGSCTHPVILAYGKDVDHEWHVRCRNCPGCVRARRFQWQMRAEAETMESQRIGGRTWLFTGTFAAQHHDLDPVKTELTLFLKRARERSRERESPFRYLVCMERHKSGALHAHALVHCGNSLRSRDVRSAWCAGFSDARLCDYRGAGYVTKYVTKDLGDDGTLKRPRIRASRGYGAWVVERDAEVVAQLLAERPEEDLTEVWRKNLMMAVREEQNRQRPSSLRKIMEMA